MRPAAAPVESDHRPDRPVIARSEVVADDTDFPVPSARDRVAAAREDVIEGQPLGRTADSPRQPGESRVREDRPETLLIEVSGHDHGSMVPANAARARRAGAAGFASPRCSSSAMRRRIALLLAPRSARVWRRRDLAGSSAPCSRRTGRPSTSIVPATARGSRGRSLSRSSGVAWQASLDVT